MSKPSNFAPPSLEGCVSEMKAALDRAAFLLSVISQHAAGSQDSELPDAEPQCFGQSVSRS